MSVGRDPKVTRKQLPWRARALLWMGLWNLLPWALIFSLAWFHPNIRDGAGVLHNIQEGGSLRIGVFLVPVSMLAVLLRPGLLGFLVFMLLCYWVPQFGVILD